VYFATIWIKNDFDTSILYVAIKPTLDYKIILFLTENIGALTALEIILTCLSIF
jgi:hypothetical protein